MENGTPSQKESKSQGSWTPATSFGPIMPKWVPIYVNGEARQPNQATWQGSECFSSVCSQHPQSNSTFLCFNSANCADMSGRVTNGEVSSTGQMSINCDNVEGQREITMDPLAEWKPVPFASLLALANAASQRKDSTATDEVCISHHHSCDLNIHPGTLHGVFDMNASEFAPITPDKAIRVKTKQLSELKNSCTDDRINHGRGERDNKIARERVDSDGIQHNKLLEPMTDASVSAVSTQIEENPNAEKGSSYGVDLNKSPQQKPVRKKHRPKVVKEGNDGTSRTAGLKGNPTVKRKYVRKKGLKGELKSSPAEAAGEFVNLKTPKPSMESCRKTGNYDIELTRDENSSTQICEGSEVMTAKPSDPKPNPTKKRKYVRKKGIDKERSPSRELATAAIDTKTPEPTKESCTPFNFDIKEQLRDEKSTCKSTLDLVLESQTKDFCPSKLTVQLVKEIEARSPKSVTPQAKENQTRKRKYVRKKGLNKDSTSTPVEAAAESNDLKTLKPAKKSCRRTLNFDVECQPRDENSMSKSIVDLNSESRKKDVHRAGTQSKSIVQLEGIEVIVENTQAGIAYDLTHSVNQLIKDYISLTEGQAPRTPLPTKTSPCSQKWNADSRKENKAERQGQENIDNGEGNTKEIVLQTDSQSSPKSLNDSKCSAFSISIEQRQVCGLKRNYSEAIKQAETGRLNLIGIHFHTLRASQMPGSHFPNIYKKKRTEKGQNSSTSCTSSSVTAAKSITLEPTWFRGEARAGLTAAGTQEGLKTLEGILDLSPVEGLKKKRSRGLTQVRDLASPTRIAECTMQQTYPGSQGSLDYDKHQVENPQKPQTCIEVLSAEMHEMLVRKNRTKKRNTLLRSTSSNTNGAQKQQKIVLNNHCLFSSNSLGTLSELTWKQMFYIDTIIEQLKNLDINRETSCIEYQEKNALVPYHMANQEHNALVICSRDDRLVPFQGPFDLIKKRHPRPKVELNEETNRVWKLLMQNINSEGIDGTDEENAKWWEEERRVFHGRVDSFIARMHLVQGDRRFSKWKGSVVDSVVGVFLTQNVSDHLSSSAFMSLAANFPLKSKNQKPNTVEETTSVIDVPVVYLLDREDAIAWKEKTSHQPVCDQSSMTLHGAEHNEEKEVASSNDSLGNSTGGVSSKKESKSKLMNSCESSPETYDNVLSSQNSMDSSIAQHADRTRSSSNSRNAEAGDLTKLNSFNGSGSFVELLQMVGSTMLHEVSIHNNVNMHFNENLKDDHKQLCTMKYDNQREKVEDLDSPKEFLQVSGIPPSSFDPCLTKDLAVEVECYEMFGEETRSSGISKNNDKDTVMDQITLTTEFSNQSTGATKLTVPGFEAPRCENKQLSNMMQEEKNITAQHQSELFGDSGFAMGSLAHAQNREMEQHLYLKKLSKPTTDAVESRIAFDNQENTRQKTPESHWNKLDNSFSKELNEINDATSKPKGRRAGKEKQNDFDWDGLRRQVEANGRKKERPENPSDSLDWEAVRCADVKKIANTIKERGMNNRLAERIKDFLNRLVRDHGSIDLEWLREVPPDKAKEYLLSIRGLGLKSVECVRLLTLHHLAFPVDTNVGRIAVRLGWVPLQPLPESLQLHLLELYPVQESIQKYLWPRLCKLDQRTLYELHYQMITFGKVFCTKSKPNCNACPMRGECRHFASAFASSRLALRGPEEKAIVHAKENRTTDQTTPALTISQIPLPLPQASKLSVGHHQLEAETVLNNCEPIIEEPATPEPECIQVSENDIEDIFCEDHDEIPTIKLNMKEFTQTLQNYMQDSLELQEADMSKALVALTAEAASILTPKLKNVSRLRTEHQVYELPDSHPLLDGLDKREPDDPGRYMLAIWTPGETANSIQPPERRCSSQERRKLCDEKTCFSCNSVRESECQIVRGTLLIPCRTAMRGSFPLNGTYFQVNEVFADHDSSLKPINVPREWLWSLPRRTVYFGTSIPTIFKGLTTEGIQHCFWRGYVCVRGFDQKTRAPRPLIARLHFPASKLSKVPGKTDADDK